MSNASDQSDDLSSALVTFDKVTKTFGSKTVIKDFSWSLPKGKVSGLLGPHDAGKTTLFRLLMGVLKATSGSLKIDGLDSFKDSIAVKRLVGYIPDEPVFYSSLNGREILHLNARMHGLDVELAMERIQPLVTRLRMNIALDQFSKDYSRGMKKKLGLLLAALRKPTLLILDEPTRGLDVESTQLFFDLMQELAQEGTTIIFSTHLTNPVERACSHAAILSEGLLMTSGTLDEICNGCSLEDTYLELTGEPALS